MTRLFLAAWIAAAPAQADCRYANEARDAIVCDREAFVFLIDQITDAEHDRDVARAANERLAAELAARLVEPEPPSVGPVLLAGGVGVLVGVVAGLLLLR